VVVDCDKCGTSEIMDLTPIAGRAWDARHLEKQLKRLGWTVVDEDDICAECNEEGAEE
jgi:hypothetical protein